MIFLEKLGLEKVGEDVISRSVVTIRRIKKSARGSR
jgi:hypothetical protein